MQKECSLVAAAAEPLERLLLATASQAPPSALEEVNAAVEALAALQARCGGKRGAGVSEPEPNAFEHAKRVLVTSVGELSLASGGSAEGRAAASDLAKALQGQLVAPPAAQPSLDTALQESQAQAEAARQQRELLEMQNKVLMEQVCIDRLKLPPLRGELSRPRQRRSVQVVLDESVHLCAKPRGLRPALHPLAADLRAMESSCTIA